MSYDTRIQSLYSPPRSLYNIKPPSLSECAKCVKKKGKLTCCGKRASWHGKCGAVGDPNFEHDWGEGEDICAGTEPTKPAKKPMPEKTKKPKPEKPTKAKPQKPTPKPQTPCKTKIRKPNTRCRGFPVRIAYIHKYSHMMSIQTTFKSTHLMTSPHRSRVDDDGVPLIPACFMLCNTIAIVIASGSCGFDGHVNAVLFAQMETQKTDLG